jgi:multiple sugar transport system permease protein
VISLRRAGRVLFGIFVIGWSLGPIYWALNVSLTTRAGLEKVPPPVIPKPFTTSNYVNLLSPSNEGSSDFYAALRNSTVEAGAATILTVLIALLAGYAFARWRFAGSRIMFIAILGTLSVPLLAVLLPIYHTTAQLGLMDTYPPIVLLAITTTLPVAVWLMRSFVAALPRDLESAARLDGAGEMRLLWDIVLPLLRPAVAAVAIIVFLTSWSAFLAPLLFSSSMNTQPITVLIPNFVTKNSTDLGLQAAAGCIAMLPPIALVLGLRRFLVSGLLRGAIK